MPVLPYITLDEAKEEIALLKDQDDISDEQLESRILFIQEYIEKLTNQFFNLREKVFLVDSWGTRIITLPVPIISITKIEIDSENRFIEQDLSGYIIFNRFFPDDRDYPKIERKDAFFPKGNQNIKVTGTFGFLNESLETPQPIKMVTKMLLLQWFKGVSESKTRLRDGKTYFKKDERFETRITESLSIGNLTGDPEIDNILTRYRRAEAVSLI